MVHRSTFLEGLDEWPSLKVLPAVDESDLEIRETAWARLVQRESDRIDLVIERESKQFIIFNTVAYLFRFIRNARQRDRDQRSTGDLSAVEILAAKKSERIFQTLRVVYAVYLTIDPKGVLIIEFQPNLGNVIHDLPNVKFQLLPLHGP